MAKATASAKRKPAKARKRNGAAAAADGVITVRMYRQGLGDCFLLRFPRKGNGGGGAKPFFMLIDCGVILGTENQGDVMTRVAEDIERTTGGQLDLLVATHEHWDHLSGFIQAKPVFERIKVKDLWLAWTEEPGHPLGTKLRKGRKAALGALRKTGMRLAASGAGSEGSPLTELLGFFGDLQGGAGGNGGGGALGAADGKGGATTEDALAFINTRVERPHYRHPGEDPITIPGVEGVRVYVLGPPEDEKLIKKSDPTKRGREVYELALDSEFEDAFISAAQFVDVADEELDPDQRRQRELSMPFDDCHTLDGDGARLSNFFLTYYGFDKGDAGPEWRRIEDDWLAASEGLALKLDSDTNNTSLALAIELGDKPGDGRVLLFPGDAQVGNWLSWESLRWPRDAKEDDSAAVTARRLLERTVLYKVGHHASHNATLREKGLELMTHPDLVAMVPVDEKMAGKKRWKMPFPGLFKRLHAKARGRILRADESLAELKARPKPDGATAAEWREFIARLDADADDGLFVELEIPL